LEAAEGGLIALIEDGDEIQIDIPDRVIHLNVDSQEIDRRHQAMQARERNAWKPLNRNRYVRRALQSYAALARSAAYGAVRDPGQL
jgi:dihydroxy-acid dehydratase